MTDPAGTETRYQYDCLNRLEEITYGNGNRTGKAGEQKLAGEEVCHLHTTYRYNVRGQLLEENRNGEPDIYTYDLAGNRIQKESSGGIVSYRYNEKNQLVSEEGIHGRKNFTYNSPGSIIREGNADGGREFLYNAKNQQVRVVHNSGAVQTSRYDAEGLRSEMKENERLLRFAYHKGELLYERSGEGETSYHHGLGIEARRDAQGTHYYHQDEQLSTALISNRVGEIQNHYQYDAFGKGLEQSEQVANRIRYTGQQYDVMTEQYYLRARYYRPELGRFTQEDTCRGDGLNLYAYCHNNPVMYYDPSGYTGLCPDAKFALGNGEELGDGYKVSDERRTHILEGDEGKPGSGHDPNRNSIQGAFPDTWTDDQAIAAIERIANNPNSVWHQKSGSGVGTDTIGEPNSNAPQLTNSGIPVKYEIIGQDHGLTILVAMEPSDRGIVTGYVKGKDGKN